MIYLASPYTHPDPQVVQSRFLSAMQYTADCLCAKEFIYSPIVHCHELATRHTLPTDFDFWKSYNFHMLGRADELRVLMLDGWETSKGVSAEIMLAQELGIKTVYVRVECAS